MTWLTENWIWVFVGVAFIAMHLSGRGCHGGHSAGKNKPGDSKKPGDAMSGKPGPSAAQRGRQSHRH